MLAAKIISIHGPRAFDVALEVTRIVGNSRPKRERVILRTASHVPQIARPIVDAVCEHYGLDHEELLSRSRVQRLRMPRMVCWRLLRERMGLSLVEIGEIFDRNHSTVTPSKQRTPIDENAVAELNARLDSLERGEAAE